MKRPWLSMAIAFLPAVEGCAWHVPAPVGIASPTSYENCYDPMVVTECTVTVRVTAAAIGQPPGCSVDVPDAVRPATSVTTMIWRYEAVDSHDSTDYRFESTTGIFVKTNVDKNVYRLNAGMDGNGRSLVSGRMLSRGANLPADDPLRSSAYEVHLHMGKDGPLCRFVDPIIVNQD